MTSPILRPKIHSFWFRWPKMCRISTFSSFWSYAPSLGVPVIDFSLSGSLSSFLRDSKLYFKVCPASLIPSSFIIGRSFKAVLSIIEIDSSKRLNGISFTGEHSLICYFISFISLFYYLLFFSSSLIPVSRRSTLCMRLRDAKSSLNLILFE